VYCSVLQYTYYDTDQGINMHVLHYGAVCCRALQCIVVRCNTHTIARIMVKLCMCCGVLQYVAVCCNVWYVLQYAYHGTDQSRNIWVLQCVAVSCSVLQYAQYGTDQGGNSQQSDKQNGNGADF